MKKIVETERLILREFTVDDADFILQLLNSPGWLQFIGDRGVKTLSDAENYLLNGPLKSYNTFGFGLWLVALKDEGTPIGMCGLLKRDTLESPDIGFAFLPEFGGFGYATEAALATMHYAQHQLKLSTIFAITKANNINSINLLKKSGLQFEKMIVMPHDPEELMLFSN